MDRAFRTLVDVESASQGMESVAEFPLTKERLAYIHMWGNEGTLTAAAKGAPEHIARLCKLSDDEITTLMDRVHHAGERGLRVLGIASASLAGKVDGLSPESIDFRFLGLAFLKDPIREGVPSAVQECAMAGIRTIMITGDHPTTAKSIASEIGLHDSSRVYTGAEIAKMSDEELAICAKECNVFARVTPGDKLRLIRALQSQGEVVAMTGDGINDAPALRAAEIGIAMGQRGTDVAREAADLIITDDDFTSIVAGIRRGRAIYANIQKAMTYVIAIHIPIFGMALIPVLVSDWPLILVPALIAFHEVIIDPASSIAFEVESPDPKIMEHAPRDVTKGVFDRSGLVVALLQGLSIFAMVFLIFLDGISDGVSEERVRSLTFASLVIANVILILANRSRTLTLWEAIFRRKNRAVPWLIFGAIFLLLLLLNVPFIRDAFELTSLSLRDYSQLILFAYLSVAWLDLLKIITRYRTSH
jgi:Ca2+-transporting ATPase